MSEMKEARRKILNVSLKKPNDDYIQKLRKIQKTEEQARDSKIGSLNPKMEIRMKK